MYAYQGQKAYEVYTKIKYKKNGKDRIRYLVQKLNKVLLDRSKRVIEEQTKGQTGAWQEYRRTDIKMKGIEV